MVGLINIGFGNVVNTNKIVTIINPDSAPESELYSGQRIPNGLWMPHRDEGQKVLS